MPIIIGGMAALGGIGGGLKKGPKYQESAFGAQARAASQNALSAYQNLVNQGPGAQDVTASLNASREYANTLNGAASGGMFNMSMGNNLAAQQFAGQRTALEQSFQDQLAQANRAASLSGRGSNDPILRARLAQEQTRQQALMSANQSAAAVDLGRQYTQDSLALGGQRVNLLQGLANQAFGNQQNLFGMGQQAAQSEFAMTMGRNQYEMSRGGGMKDILTGAIAGAGSGMGMAQGLSAIGANNAQASFYQNQGAMQPMQASPNTMAAMGGGDSTGSSMGRVAAQNFAPRAAAVAPMSAPIAGVSAPSMVAPWSGAVSLPPAQAPVASNSFGGYGSFGNWISSFGSGNSGSVYGR